MLTIKRACAIPWAVCPFCTYPLSSSGGKSWCTHEGCLAASGWKITGQGWGATEREPCPDVATVEVTDSGGARMWLCAGHAAAYERAVVEAADLYPEPEPLGTGGPPPPPVVEAPPVVVLCRTSDQVLAAIAEAGIAQPRCLAPNGRTKLPCIDSPACDAKQACLEVNRLHREMAAAGIVYHGPDCGCASCAPGAA